MIPLSMAQDHPILSLLALVAVLVLVIALELIQKRDEP